MRRTTSETGHLLVRCLQGRQWLWRGEKPHKLYGPHWTVSSLLSSGDPQSLHSTSLQIVHTRMLSPRHWKQYQNFSLVNIVKHLLHSLLTDTLSLCGAFYLTDSRPPSDRLLMKGNPPASSLRPLPWPHIHICQPLIGRQKCIWWKLLKKKENHVFCIL